ncbi:hypothetical protein FB567DRAFT_556963 [Paraphoma chrysanthemicola]|uniref:FAD-binding domain-containing protein n=1 Tax=Paraphoma chrysanthemicola TaxID=798071 RepID=A0A8K0RJJ2_9PLEO|nr:hypothetical protein FB567DRAFT_556963 [Paraphoma chrysanthemicola]
MSLNILVVGAGCAGPAFAHLLQKVSPSHNITVIERFSSLRTGGQQIDLKSQGVPITKGMGILPELKAACVHETGMQLVDKNGKSLMGFGINSAATGQGFNLTNEYEIMRGDMVNVFYDGSIAERQKIEKNGGKEGSLTYKFNTTMTQFTQTENGVDVTFSNGEKQHFDLVVAADGQNSRTRRTTFGDDINEKSFRTLGIHGAYYNIPRLESDDSDARIHFAPGGRMIMTRTGDRPITQVYLFIMRDKARHEHFKSVHKLPLDQQKEEWANTFKDAGWQCDRFMEGLKNTTDFYAHELGQVHMPKLYSGRVVLLGDAGYCPSPFTGMGTTLSLIGSYILAGELAKHDKNIEAALQAYHELMQPPLEKYQRFFGGSNTGFYPSSQLGITVTNHVLWALSSLRVDKLMLWMGGWLPAKKDDWKMPVYPGLSLVEDTKE